MPRLGVFDWFAPTVAQGNPSLEKCRLISGQTGKTTIRRAAVREAGVSRYHGGPIEDRLKPLIPS